MIEQRPFVAKPGVVPIACERSAKSGPIRQIPQRVRSFALLPSNVGEGLTFSWLKRVGCECFPGILIYGYKRLRLINLFEVDERIIKGIVTTFLRIPFHFWDPEILDRLNQNSRKELIRL